MKTLFKILFLVFLLLGFFNSASSASIEVSLEKKSLAIGEDFLVSIFLNTENKKVNAFAGKINYPSETFEIKSFRTGGSVATLWLEAPQVSKSGEIFFSGIVPGGYQGERGFLFSFVLRSQKEGRYKITAKDLEIFLHDGLGTSVSAKNIPANLEISDKQVSAKISLDEKDISPPEPFEILVVKDENLFTGKKAIIFEAEDKGLGIKEYLICEGFFRKCFSGSSPHLLKNQLLDDLVRVKAVDYADNFYIAHLFTGSALLRYVFYLIVVIIFYMFGRFVWRKIF